MLLILLIVACALAFDFINGFHDTANAIATVVSTRVLTPRVAIVMAASLNFVGALTFTKVAETIAKGLVTGATQHVILAAIVGAIVWNLITLVLWHSQQLFSRAGRRPHRRSLDPMVELDQSSGMVCGIRLSYRSSPLRYPAFSSDSC